MRHIEATITSIALLENFGNWNAFFLQCGSSRGEA